ncbi:MAG: ribosomal protein, partial [Parcubacteria group bacterium]|nr:ribosomal protein [Parcubacteria group bacterium]
MALFSNTPKKAPAKSAKVAKTPSVKALPADGRLENVLIAPWLSEKALIGTEHGVYVFEVPRMATKTQVKAAIEMIYKVKPRQVRMVNLPAKTVNLRTRRGVGTRARR